MIFLTSPGKTYSVNSVGGCTISAGGTTLATIPANIQTTFIAPEEEVIVSDDNAIIVEVTGVGAGGSGGTGGSGGSGGPVDLTGVALLEGGNAFTGDQTIEGDVTINGTLTVSGDVTTEGEYIGAEVIETTDTTITPEAGKYYKYTGTEDTLTVSAPDWNGYATISYLETATPVDLQGVTWNPAKPILTGNGPFVYTLVHAGDGQMLAGAYGYSVATAEAVQAVAPIAWDDAKNVRFGGETRADVDGTAIGFKAQAAGTGNVAIGKIAKTSTNYNVAIGFNPIASGVGTIAIGTYATARNTNIPALNRSIAIGAETLSDQANAVTLGAQFTETVNGQNVTHTCQTKGTGSITIGAGANTLNNGDTESSNSVTIGCKASNTGADSVVIGATASNVHVNNIVIGTGAESKAAREGNTVLGNYASSGGNNSVIIGCKASSTNHNNILVGYETSATAQYSLVFGMKSSTSAENTIVIGSKAAITNTTNADNTVTPSENTIVIGREASASASNAVVMGTGASNAGEDSVVIGAQAKGGIGVGQTAIGIQAEATNAQTVALGKGAKATGSTATAIGARTLAAGNQSIALGNGSSTAANFSVAIGRTATVSDLGAVAFRSTAEDSNTYTQLYFSGANTPLANTYEEGEAMMGYVVMQKGEDGKFAPVAAGTQKLSVLFPNNSGFQPATLGLDDEMTPPKVFHPSDLDLPPQEEPTEPEDVTITIPDTVIPEPEPYTPLPVYPVTEPENVEINIPEPEPYTPLPVYPIVEPEIPSES